MVRSRGSVMKRSYLKNIAALSLILCFCFWAAASCQRSETHNPAASKKPTPTTGKSKSQTQVPNAVADLQKTHALLKKYEKELPQAQAARPHDLAELARLCFILGEWGAADQQRYFDQGRHFANLLIQERPQEVAGHYWLALNLGGLAEMSGDLSMIPAIVKEMKIAATLDASYNQGGPHRILGRVYFEAPPWPLSVGDLQKSAQHLRQAVNLAPTNSTNHLFLAETLMELGKTGQACQQLRRTLAATQHANWPSALMADHAKADKLLQQCPGTKKASLKAP
jgi:tetratricopeptide (TPR) repeat protein